MHPTVDSVETFDHDHVTVRFHLPDGRRGHVNVRSGFATPDVIEALVRAGAAVLTDRDGAQLRVGTINGEGA